MTDDVKVFLCCNFDEMVPDLGEKNVTQGLTRWVRAEEAATYEECMQDMIAKIQSAWPVDEAYWNQSPVELITRLIEERDEACTRVQDDLANGICPVCRQKEGDHEPMCAWGMEADELHQQLSAAEDRLLSNHPESWSRITKKLTGERDIARQVARNLWRLLMQHDELPDIHEEFLWLIQE